MTDDQKGQEEKVEGQPLVEMPATDQPVEVSAQPTEEARPAESEGELPKEVSERTRKEFEKLKEHNRQLAEKLKSVEQPKPQRRSALDMFAPQEQQVAAQQPPVFNPQFGPQVAAQPQPEEIKPIVPDENGYVDIQAVNQAISRINEMTRKVEVQAKTAEQKAMEAVDKVSKYEHTDKTLKTYAKHPYLDPNGDQFDDKFSDLVTKELLFQMYSGGKQDYLAAADAVQAKYYDPTRRVEQPDPRVEKAKENVSKRDQITPPSTGAKSVEPDQEELVRASRSGDRNALYQRLVKSGY
jgi:hypothetical protein